MHECSESVHPQTSGTYTKKLATLLQVPFKFNVNQQDNQIIADGTHASGLLMRKWYPEMHAMNSAKPYI